VTDGRSVRTSWCRAPRYFLLSDSYGFVLCGAPSLTRGGSAICTCCWPLSAQSFLGPSPLGLATVFYCLRFKTSLFVASYDSQGHGGGIRPRLHTGTEPVFFNWTPGSVDCLQGNSSAWTPRKTFPFAVKNACLLARFLAMDTCEPHRKHILRHWYHCCVHVFRELPRNGSTCHSTCIMSRWILQCPWRVWAYTWDFRLSHVSSHGRTWKRRGECSSQRLKRVSRSARSPAVGHIVLRFGCVSSRTGVTTASSQRLKRESRTARSPAVGHIVFRFGCVSSRTGVTTAYPFARLLPNFKFVDRLNNLFYNGEFYRQQSIDNRTDTHSVGGGDLRGTSLELCALWNWSTRTFGGGTVLQQALADDINDYEILQHKFDCSWLCQKLVRKHEGR
jgi:hypothetical protein